MTVSCRKLSAKLICTFWPVMATYNLKEFYRNIPSWSAFAVPVTIYWKFPSSAVKNYILVLGPNVPFRVDSTSFHLNLHGNINFRWWFDVMVLMPFQVRRHYFGSIFILHVTSHLISIATALSKSKAIIWAYFEVMWADCVRTQINIWDSKVRWYAKVRWSR